MKSITARFVGYLETLRFPWLLLVTSLLFLVNVFVPDAFPFIDELLLGLIAVVLGRLKRPAGGKAAKDDDPD